jgi:hypothetical protein
VRKLEGRRAVVAEEHLHPGDEVVEVRNLGEDVVAEDEAGALAVVDEPLRAFATEELDQSRHTARLGGLGDVRGRVDSQDLYAGADEVLEEVAVVGGQLDDEVVCSQLQALADHLDVLPRMLDPCRGIRREVRVLREDLVWSDERLELDEVAPLAGEDAKREERLHVPRLVDSEEALAEWRHAEIDDCEIERRATEAARRPLFGGSWGVCAQGFGVGRVHR